MRKTVKTASVLLCLMMLLSLVPVSAAPATATLRVEGAEKNLLYRTDVEIEGEITVLELLKGALDKEKIEYSEKDGYFEEIAGEAAGAFGGWDGWIFYVNGQEATAGMADTAVKAGDDVLVCYSDAYGTPPTLLPTLSASRDADGIVTLTLTAQVTVFDEDGGMSAATVPADGVTLKADGKEYISDENGAVVLDKTDSAKAKLGVQISKADEKGKPLVVRFAPDYSVDLSAVKYVKRFTDITPGVWYEEYVYELVALGAINGYDDGEFKPSKTITRAEFIKILATANGTVPTGFKASFTDVAQGAWYASYVTWAVDNKIVDAAPERFYPNNNLTREDMAVMLARFNANILKKTLPQDKPAPTFTDEAQISPDAAESIYLLQKAGIFEGRGDGRFDPKGSAQRSEASKIIVMLLNIE